MINYKEIDKMNNTLQRHNFIKKVFVSAFVTLLFVLCVFLSFSTTTITFAAENTTYTATIFATNLGGLTRNVELKKDDNSSVFTATIRSGGNETFFIESNENPSRTWYSELPEAESPVPFSIENAGSYKLIFDPSKENAEAVTIAPITYKIRVFSGEEYSMMTTTGNIYTCNYIGESTSLIVKEYIDGVFEGKIYQNSNAPVAIAAGDNTIFFYPDSISNPIIVTMTAYTFRLNNGQIFGGYEMSTTDGLTYSYIYDGQKTSFFITDGYEVWNNDGNYFQLESGKSEILFTPKASDKLLAVKVRLIESAPAENDYTIVKIRTAEDFVAFAKNCILDTYADNVKVQLTTDIDLSSYPNCVIPVFGGIFEGNYHKISGIDISMAGENIGLFRYTKSESIIRNLILETKTAPNGAKENIGGIVGNNFGTIADCTVFGSVEGTLNVGGIVGYNNVGGIIKKCENHASVDGYYQTGGITGINGGDVKNCDNYGKINTIDRNLNTQIIWCGGICGNNLGTIYVCNNYARVGKKEVTSYVGGIAGVNFGNIGGSKNSGDIECITQGGGICGNYGSISDSENDAIIGIFEHYYHEVFGSGAVVPDLPVNAYVDASLRYCGNTGNVYGSGMTGGISGGIGAAEWLNGYSIIACYNKGEITAQIGYAGGIVGNMPFGIIIGCYNTGLICSDGTYAGGIAGYSDGTIKGCFSLGQVDGTSYVGGIAGSGNIVSQCYAYNVIKNGGEKFGAIAGNLIGSESEYNYFVLNEGSTLGGIDGINYAGKAEEISIEKLVSSVAFNPELIGFSSEYWLTSAEKYTFPRIKSFYEADNYPETAQAFATIMNSETEFKLNVDFYDENGLIKRVRVDYNGSFNSDEFPSLPVKEGYFIRWENFQQSNITENIIVNAIYVKGVTSLLAETDNGERILIEGLFHPDTLITVYAKNSVLPVELKDKYEVGKTYCIKITLDGKDVEYDDLIVKFKTSENYTVVLSTKSGFAITPSENESGYLSFTMDESDAFMLLSAVRMPIHEQPWFYPSVAVVIVILIFTVTLSVRRKKSVKQQ